MVVSGECGGGVVRGETVACLLTCSFGWLGKKTHFVCVDARMRGECVVSVSAWVGAGWVSELESVGGWVGEWVSE